jgi:hypothetical protein
MRLLVYCRSSLDRRPECLSAPDAVAAPAEPNVTSPMDFSLTTARLVRPEITPAHALILLTSVGVQCTAIGNYPL